MIEYTISFIFIFLLGYFIGRRNDPLIEKIKYRARKLGVVMTNTATGKPASGIIYRPSAKRLRQIKGEQKPENEAIVESLEQLPEIQEAKRALHR